MTRLWIAVVAVLAGGCADFVSIPPPAAEGFETLVFVFGARGGPPEEIAVFDTSNIDPPVVAPFEGPKILEAWFLDGPPAAHGLRVGRVDGQMSGRPAPTDHVFAANIVNGAATPWERTGAPLFRDDIRVEESPGACLAGGGCFVTTSGMCMSPCPMPTPVLPPAAPGGPDVTCPWTPSPASDDHPEVIGCEPWAAGTPECGTEEIFVPGEEGCQLVGQPCPSSGWADTLPQGPVQYVHAGASTPGDGSMGSPFATIGDAIAAARDGDVIALARGNYREALVIDKPVTIAGACVGQTRLIGDIEDMIVVDGPNVTLTNFRVLGGETGMVVRPSASVTARDMIFESQLGDGLVIGDAVLETVVVRNPAYWSIYITGDDRADLNRVLIDGATSAGIFVDGTNARIRNTVVRDVRSRTGFPGYGVAGLDATIEIDRLVIERAVHGGIHVVGGSLAAGNVLVRGTSFEVSGDGFVPGGVVIRDAAVTNLRGLWIDADQTAGFVVEGARPRLLDSVITGVEGPAVRARDEANVEIGRVVVADAGPIESLNGGRIAIEDVATYGTGLRVDRGSTLTAKKVTLSAVDGPAVVVGSGSTVDLTDVRIDGAGDASCLPCAGICVSGESNVTGDRVAVSNTIGGAIAARHLTSSLHFTNFSAAMTDLRESCEPVAAVDASRGAAIRLQLFDVRSNGGPGVAVEGTKDQTADETSLDLHDGIVADNPVGLVVDHDTYDIRRAGQSVRYVDNDVAVRIE